MKCKWTLCLDLGPIPKIPYLMHLTIPKEKEKKFQIWNTSDPKHFWIKDIQFVLLCKTI